MQVLSILSVHACALFGNHCTKLNSTAFHIVERSMVSQLAESRLVKKYQISCRETSNVYF